MKFRAPDGVEDHGGAQPNHWLISTQLVTLGRRHGHRLGLDKDRGRAAAPPTCPDVHLKYLRLQHFPPSLDTPRVRPHELAHGGPGLAPARRRGRDLRGGRVGDLSASTTSRKAFLESTAAVQTTSSAPLRFFAGSGRAPAARLFQASSSASFRALVFQKRARRCPSGTCPAGRAAAAESSVGRVLTAFPQSPGASFELPSGAGRPRAALCSAFDASFRARSWEYHGIFVGAALLELETIIVIRLGRRRRLYHGYVLLAFFISQHALVRRGPGLADGRGVDDARRRRRAALRLRAFFESWLASNARLWARSSCLPCQVVGASAATAVRRPMVPGAWAGRARPSSSRCLAGWRRRQQQRRSEFGPLCMVRGSLRDGPRAPGRLATQRRADGWRDGSGQSHSPCWLKN